MPITYDSETNTITVVGTKNGNPYSFEDIWQADVNNGWGKFLKLSEGVYKTTAKLRFGNGRTETLFEEKGTVLIIDHVATKDWDTVVTFKANCKAQFGEKQIVDGKVVCENGVEFVGYETVYNTIILTHEEGSNVSYYGCKFKHISGSNRFRFSSLRNEAIGCLFEWFIATPTDAKIESCILIGEHGHITSPINTQISSVLIRTTMSYAFWMSNDTLTFSNLDIVTTERLASVYRLQSPNVVKLINCKPHNWKIDWYLESSEVSGELQRIYAVRFKVTDVNGNPLSGRTVKVYDKNGNKIAEAVTDSNGLTDEVKILYAKLINPYSDGQWHTFTDEDWEYFNPFTIEVYYGNELEYRGVITDLDVESTFIQITVKPSSLTINDLADKIEYIRKLFGNRWKIENNELKIYDDDNQTVIRRFKLYDKEGKPTETNVYDRVPV